MAKCILTNREVKNKVTGVDIYVSDYQEVPHRIKNDYLYHVIVVSNLFYYKTREHRESDVVQFMVSKTFAEFEDLYKRLFKRFPSVNFPPLPEKSLFSRNPSGHLECMDKVLKMVASTQKLSSSPMVISFLRGDCLPNVKDEEVPEIEAEPTDVPDGIEEPPTKDDNEFHDVELFDTKPQEIVEEVIFSENIQPVLSGKSIFDDDSENGENDTDLFPTTNTNPIVFNKKFKAAEILDLSDDEVDELMNLSLTSEKQSSIKVHKRQSAKARVNQNKRMANILDDDESTEKEDMFKTSKQKSSLWRDHNHHTIDDIFGPKKSSLFDLDDDDDLFRTSVTKKEVKVENMKQDDIMDYIKAHDDTFEPKLQKQQPDATNQHEDLSATESLSEEQNVSLVTEEGDMSLQNEQAVTADILIQNISITEQIPLAEGVSLPSEGVTNSVTVEMDSESVQHDLHVDDTVTTNTVSPAEQDDLIRSEPFGETATAETDNSHNEKDISIPFGHISVSVREPKKYVTVEHEISITEEQIAPSIVDETDSHLQQNICISSEQIFDYFTEQLDGDFSEQDNSVPTDPITSPDTEQTNSALTHDMTVPSQQFNDSMTEQIDCPAEQEISSMSEEIFSPVTDLVDTIHAEQDISIQSRDIFLSATDQSYNMPALEKNVGMEHNGDSVSEQNGSETIDCSAGDPRDTYLPILADPCSPMEDNSFDISTPHNGFSVAEQSDSSIQAEFSTPNCAVMKDNNVITVEHNGGIVTEDHGNGVLGEQNNI